MKFAVVCTQLWEILDYIESTTHAVAQATAERVWGDDVIVVLDIEDNTL